MSADAIFIAAPLGAYWLGTRLDRLYRQRGLVKANYRGLSVAPALGPALLLGYQGAVAAAVWLGDDPLSWLPSAFVVLAAAFFGLWDDLMEDRTSGFAGHLKAGLRGELTGGLLKIITAVLAVIIFTGSLNITLFERLTAMLVILLSANGLNLLDRRPGRAVKSFFFIGLLLIFLAHPSAQAARLLLPLLGAALALAPLDLRAESMLGDCGSNLLGAVLGLTAVLYLTVSVQMTIIFFWSLVHLISERNSISTIIDGNNLLRYFDLLGRAGEKNS